MNCIFCNNQTIITSQNNKQIFHHCESCSPFAYFVSKNNELTKIFFYSSDEKLGPAYRIYVLLDQNKTLIQWVNQEEVNGEWLIQDEKPILAINKIVNVTPDNFHNKLKTYLVFS